MGWFSRICLIGAILILIDGIIETTYSYNGIPVIILSSILIVLSFYIIDDSEYTLFVLILILILNYIIQYHLHLIIDVNWATASRVGVLEFFGVGFIGFVLVYLSAMIPLLLIIMKIVLLEEAHLVKARYLFLIGYVSVGINLLIYLIIIEFVFTSTSMLAVLYFSLLTISAILIFLGQKMIPATIILLIAFFNTVGGTLATPVTGYSIGMILMGGVNFFYSANELGYWLAETRKPQF